MPLQSGSRLGVYEITSCIGAGGMGQVWLATDTTLGRQVAIKILPDAFAADPDRVARFEREAKTLASLNDPHIAAIYGFEKSSGAYALVMELVEGEDLSARIARGRMPIDEALPIAAQIAEALEVAHEQGVIHRDLKPANIKIRDDGTVKVLDFGLAKAMAPAGSSSEAAMNSPTLSLHATQAGVILGTAAYMAPEQARGRVVDRRADIWAFGCVLYEMLTGRRPFGGDDVSMTLAAVLKEPVDFAALPDGTPPSVVRLLRRCLEKDPQKRLRAIGDARLELDAAATEPAVAPVSAAAPSRPWPARLGWAAAGAVIVGAAVAVFLLSRPAASVPIVWSQIALPPSIHLSGDLSIAIDASGREVIYPGRDGEGAVRLYRRRLDQDQSEPIPGTEGGALPQLSADGRWLFFVQSEKLMRLPKDGGAAAEMASMPNAHGIAPLPDGGAVYTPAHGGGLFRVQAPGATPVELTKVDQARGEAGHHWPHMLPDGRHVLFTTEIDGKPYADARIELLSLDSGERRVVIDGGTDARYVPGYLVFWRTGDLWSVPFDLASLQASGSAVAVAHNVVASQNTGHAAVSIAGNGTLAYVPGGLPEEDRGLMLVDRTGAARELTRERRAYWTAASSPDGRRIASAVLGANDSIWLVDVERGQASRATFEAENHSPVWDADGQRLVFSRYRGGEPGSLFIMPADGSTPPEPLPTTGDREWPGSWSTAAGVLAFQRTDSSKDSSADIWIMPADRRGKPSAWLATRFWESGARLSPDGRWMAYASNESGRFEVYVRAFPGPGAKYTISDGGGKDPRWRADGREIFFRNGNTVLAAEVTTTPAFRASVPRALFSGSYFFNEAEDLSWDVMPDGQSFVLIRQFSEPPTAVSIVQGWWDVIRSARDGK